MNPTPESILKQYWGFDDFRAQQREIIQEALDGSDVLALLPTGGGKSICFQVPALCNDGICIVVSPLVALMKDQVENLKKKGINAMLLHSGMRFSQIDSALDTCIYGDVKFLYLSPERLRNEMVQVRIQKMNVNLLAVDEAHCISQWGYDFRPPYLQIAEIRELLPKVPVLALTATATPKVVDNIQEKLQFKKKNVIRKSFARENLSYMILKEDDLKGRMLRILSKTPGSAIVYVRNRRRTKEIAQFLQTQNVSASFYHAGLSFDERQTRQEDWINDKTRVIVATNAFGMGIDKPDVRLVIHVGFPDSLEGYFQEAGRGGRDGKESFAVALVNNHDITELQKKLNHDFTTRERIKEVYYSIGSSLQLAEGSGEDEWFDFDLAALSERYKWNPKEVMEAISFLEKADHLIISANSDSRSQLKIRVNHDTLYDIEIRNPKIGRLTKVLLRSYGRMFEDFVPISETLIAKRAGYSLEQTVAILDKLHKLEVVDYRPSTGLPKLSFVGGRVRKQDIHISKEVYEVRINLIRERIKAALHFVQTDKVCRSQILLKYFGETDSQSCGKCDVCRGLSKFNLNEEDVELVKSNIHSETSLEELFDKIEKPEKEILKAVQLLLDNNELVYHMNGKIGLP
ncbi:MAG: RecQ family ATP-dependent DNA helicase [Flavobacteriales bacterium]|nr:RecQ family ATP-dependent DNA helicase [Flavobacteriales bacterium]